MPERSRGLASGRLQPDQCYGVRRRAEQVDEVAKAPRPPCWTTKWGRADTHGDFGISGIRPLHSTTKMNVANRTVVTDWAMAISLALSCGTVSIYIGRRMGKIKPREIDRPLRLFPPAR